MGPSQPPQRLVLASLSWYQRNKSMGDLPNAIGTSKDGVEKEKSALDLTA